MHSDIHVVPLRDYLEGKIHATELVLSERINAVRDAIRIATSALDRRLEGMNEIREAMNDRERHLATKESVRSLEEQVHLLRDAITEMGGRTRGFAPVAQHLYSVALIIVAAVVAFVVAKIGG